MSISAKRRFGLFAFVTRNQIPIFCVQAKQGTIPQPLRSGWAAIGPDDMSSGARGFHPHALTEPYLSLSAHTALTVQPLLHYGFASGTHSSPFGLIHS